MRWGPDVPLPFGIGRAGGPTPLRLRASPRDIFEPENEGKNEGFKLLFRMRGLSYAGGTGGDADDRSRRSPLPAMYGWGWTRLLWLINILAEGIESFCMVVAYEA